jgi:hypothetical protein
MGPPALTKKKEAVAFCGVHFFGIMAGEGVLTA